MILYFQRNSFVLLCTYNIFVFLEIKFLYFLIWYFCNSIYNIFTIPKIKILQFRIWYFCICRDNIFVFPEIKVAAFSRLPWELNLVVVAACGWDGRGNLSNVSLFKLHDNFLSSISSQNMRVELLNNESWYVKQRVFTEYKWVEETVMCQKITTKHLLGWQKHSHKCKIKRKCSKLATTGGEICSSVVTVQLQVCNLEKEKWGRRRNRGGGEI